MSKIWTDDDFRALKAALQTSRSIHEIAMRLDRELEDVEEMARDLGWIKDSLGAQSK